MNIPILLANILPIKMSLFTEQEILNFDPNSKFEFKEPEPKLDLDFSSFIIIDNLPKATKDKVSKLEALIAIILSLKDTVQVLRVEISTNSEGDCAGYGFAQFKDEKTAREVVQKIDGFEIDKKMKLNLKLNSLLDYEKFEKEMENSEFQPKLYKEPTFLSSWLLDKQGRDQFAIRYYDVTEILWNDPTMKSVSVFKKEKFAGEYGVTWSPQGTFVATYHEKGIVLWGGDKFEKQGAYSHTHPKKIDFSPKEKFLVTCNDDKEKNLVIWDVRTAKARHVITLPKENLQNWPVFKWSHDDKYTARISEVGLHILNTKSWQEEIIKMEKIQDFCWSPNGNLISYWVAENAGVPAKIAVMEYPTRRELRAKNFFKLTSCSMNWSTNGEMVYFIISSELKKNAPPKVTLELFFTQIKDYPVSTLPLEQPVVDHAWEPKGNKLSLILSETSGGKNSIFLYHFIKADIKQHGKISNKQFDKIIWSPRGQYMVITNTKQMSGTIEFWDSNSIEFLGHGEHFMVSDFSWDPTGRYFTTSVSYSKHQSENGYIIWNFLGRVLDQLKTEKFWQFNWRPRPKSLLSEDEERKLIKDINKKKLEVQEENKKHEEEQKKLAEEKKKELMDSWLKLKSFLSEEYQKRKEIRKSLRGGYLTDDENDLVEVKQE